MLPVIGIFWVALNMILLNMLQWRFITDDSAWLWFSVQFTVGVTNGCMLSVCISNLLKRNNNGY